MILRQNVMSLGTTVRTLRRIHALVIVRAPIGMIRRGCTDGNVFRVDTVENNGSFILLTAPAPLPWGCAGFGPAHKFV